jgi:hypothetical protein
MIHKLEPEDCPKHRNFCETMQAEMDNNENIARCLVFSDEATFHSSG